MDLSDLIRRNAAFSPDKVAIRFEGRDISYSAFVARIDALAQGLSRRFSIERGDRVALLSANHPDFLALLYACARLGAVLVPLNWRLAAPEHLFILKDSGARLLVLEQAFEALSNDAAAIGVGLAGIDFLPPGGASLDEIAQTGPPPRPAEGSLSDPLLIVYTSGTTGRPKGAVLRQGALVANAAMSQHMHDMTSADTILTVLPMFHVGGLNIQTTPALQLGATVVLHARFAPGPALQSIERDCPTLTVMVPAVMQAVMAHPAWSTTRLSSLRALTTGSTQVPQSLIDPFVARGLPVLQVYGATETAPIAVYTRISGDWRRPGSTGLPGLLCEARVVDDDGREVAPGTPGEIEVRGPNVMTAYWNAPDATAETLHEGWYRSGDIGTRDADGYFWVHDRKKNVIISGAENIYPAEVERVLLTHPAIAEAAVVARPDPRWQEVPVACVVLKPGTAATPAEIEAFCLAELARYKVPRDYRFFDDLPRNAMGKVQHFALKEQLGSMGINRP